MSIKLKPYNKEAICRKCGSDDINTVYHENGECEFGCGYRGPWIIQEHILRDCRNCHYEWREKPLNVKEPK